MKLIDASRVAGRIGFEPGVQAGLIASATAAATPALAGLLRTEFDRASVVDDFYVLSTKSLPLRRDVYRTRLALSRGFVQGPVALSYASARGDLDVNPYLIESGHFAINAELGTIIVTGPNLQDTFVRATYVAGFAEDTANPGSYAAVPDWLKDAAEMQAIIELDTLGVETAKDLRGNELSRRLGISLGSRIRYFPAATYPIQ